MISYCQEIVKDTIVLYSDYDNYIENPFKDSIRIKSKEAQRKGWILPDRCPDYYFEIDSQRIPLQTRIDQISSSSSDSFEYKAICLIYMDWQGILREIKIIAYEGVINTDELKAFFSGIKAKRIISFGYGIDTKCLTRIIK